MDMNLLVLQGRLAAPPELRTFDSGARLLRLLITVKADEPRRRVDVLPITLWDPSDEVLAEDLEPGRRIRTAGSIQRRFWSESDTRRSRLEIVAGDVSVHPGGEENRG